MIDPRVQILCDVDGCRRPVRCKGLCSIYKGNNWGWLA